MSVSPALTNNERAALAGVSTLARYLSPVPDADIATALINQASFTYPLFELTVDNTSADWGDVREGDTVYIGTSAGASDVGIYRVRLTPSSTILYLGETSAQDVGLVPVSIRTASFANNQYVTVKRRFDLWSILPVINPATGAIYEDGALVVGTSNTTPPPLVNVVINHRRNHLATLIPDGETFALEAIATPTSWATTPGESYTYNWMIPASGWSDVTGETGDTLTANVEPGNYLLGLEVTGDESGTTERFCYVHIHDDSTNPPLLISEMPRSDVRDRTGRRMSFNLYSNRLASIPNGACVIYFEMAAWANQWVNSEGSLAEALDSSEDEIDVDDGSLFAEDDILLIDGEQMQVVSIASDTLTVERGYNGTVAAAHADESVIYRYAPATDVPTATRQFVGWAQRHDKSVSPGLRQATLELISPSFLLGMLNSTSTIVSVTGTVGTWQRIAAALSSASFMAWYMLRWRCANLLRLFNFTPFSVDPVGQRLPSWQIDKGTLLQQIQVLATDRGNFGCDSEGEFYFLRHPNLMPYPRSGVVVRDSVDASIYSSASNPRELQNRVQQVRGETFHWDGAAALPTPGYSDSPKVPGQGTSQIKLPSQVAVDQTELEQLTGDRYAHANNPYPAVGYKIQRNRDVIEPAHMAFAAVNIPDTLSATGEEYDSNIIPVSVTKVHNQDGTADMDVSGEGETHNLPGDFVPVPAGNESVFTPEYAPPPVDPLPEFSLGDFNSVSVPAAVPSPQGKTVSPGKGAIWVSADGTKVYRTFDITVASPVVEDITPPDAFFTAFVMVVHDKSKNFSRGAYALGNDGADSKVAYTTDVYADAVQWEIGGILTGTYSALESAGMESLAGGVVAYNPAGGLASGVTYVVTTGTDNLPTSIISAVATSGDVLTPPPPTAYRRPIVITFDSPIRRVTFNYNYGGGSTGDGLKIQFGTEAVQSVGQSGAFDQTSTSDQTVLTIHLGYSASSTAYDDSPMFITDLVGYELTNTDVIVSTSDDYGATWTDEVVGDAPGAAFCISRFGKVAFAGVDGTLEKASSFGGVFSPATGGGTSGTYPVAVRIPWFKIGKPSKTNNTTTPDYYKASATAVSGETLWKVIAGVPTAITPDVTGTEALGVGVNCIGTYGANRICFVGQVGADRYVFSSKNSGATWTTNQIDGAEAVRAQRFSPSGLIWLLCAGADGLYYSNNGGTSWSARTVPDGALFGEIFG